MAPGSNRAGVADGLGHGGVAVGVAVADEVDAPEFPTAVGPSNLDLVLGYFVNFQFCQSTIFLLVKRCLKMFLMTKLLHQQ